MVKSVKKKRFGLGRIILTLVVIAALGGMAYIILHHSSTKPTVPSEAASSATTNSREYSTSPSLGTNQENNIRKTSGNAASQTLNNGPTTTSGSSATGSTSNSVSSISVLVTRAGVIGSDLEVGAQVSGVTSGTCTLTVSQNGEQSVVKTESVALQNNAYVCPVFDIPTSSFPNQGVWNVSVSLSSQGQQTSNSWGSVTL